MSLVLGHSGWCPFSAILKQAVGQSVVHVFAYFLRMEIPEVECRDGETRPGRAPWAPPPQRKERGESGAPTSRGRDSPCSGGGLEQIPPSRFQPLKMLPGPCSPSALQKGVSAPHQVPVNGRAPEKPSGGPTQDIPDSKGPVDPTCIGQHSNSQWL